MKKLLKKLLPNWSIALYHLLLAKFAALYYGFPSHRMIVIGVTGTKGKTSTINFIWACLMAGGYKTGIISTANIRIGEKEFLNSYHMTMPGRFTIQRLLAQMAKEGCTYCLVETTSEGIKQYRHIGVQYDIAVFTNLSPEHLPSHGGSYEKYRQAKEKMFASLMSHKKLLKGKRIEKVIIANNDDEHVGDFLKYQADKKITYAIHNAADVVAGAVEQTNTGVRFRVEDTSYALSILGTFNIYNALPAIIVARLAGVSEEHIAQGLAGLSTIPGRMEIINEGQSFTVIVDYAHEKQSMTNVLATANEIKVSGARTIVLLGAEGGGRDKAKRPIMGEIAAKLADGVVVSNVDPYDDDPKEILKDIASVAEKFGKVRGDNLFVIEDRTEGIRKALSLANANDIVLITGKGAEQSMVVGEQNIPWDDRQVVRSELHKLLEKVA